MSGFGIVAPGVDHDDYQSADIQGRVVLALDHEPGEFDPMSPFRRTTYIATRGLIRTQALGSKGACRAAPGRSGDPLRRRRAQPFDPPGAGRIHAEDVALHRASRDEFPPTSWPIGSSHSGSPPSASRSNKPNASQRAPERPWKHRRSALAQRAEDAGGVAPIALPGVIVEVEASVQRQTLPVHNVVGLIEGADPVLRDEWIILCAHCDHEGANGTQVFTGADDDASGVAGILEIAEAYAFGARVGRRPRRSILFAAWNAEERGLLGAWAYTQQPLAPLENTVAVINMNMIGRNEEVPTGGGRRFNGLEPQTAESNRNAVNILGYSYSSDLQKATEIANNAAGLDLRFRYDNNRSNLLRRSDHWPFLFHSVPAIFVHTGLHPDYHTERDRPETLDYDKMSRVVRLVFQLSWNLAQEDSRPALD